jgi:ADP-ribose pyrophosphatase YjhB (NUDIX family)
MPLWCPHVTVAAILERDGRFLLVEEDTPDGRRLNQPAGHLEPQESLTQACIRETLEETAWHMRPDALVGVYLWPRQDGESTTLRFAFAGRLIGHDAQRKLDAGIVRTVWLAPEDIEACRAQHRSPLVSQAVRDYVQGQRYPLALLRDLGHGAAGLPSEIG